jgi:hypothetical protein
VHAPLLARRTARKARFSPWRYEEIESRWVEKVAIGLKAPADVHYGRADTIRAHRAEDLDAAYAARSERFVRHPPTPPALPKAAWINKPGQADTATTQ